MSRSAFPASANGARRLAARRIQTAPARQKRKREKRRQAFRSAPALIARCPSETCANAVSRGGWICSCFSAAFFNPLQPAPAFRVAPSGEGGQSGINASGRARRKGKRASEKGANSEGVKSRFSLFPLGHHAIGNRAKKAFLQPLHALPFMRCLHAPPPRARR